MEILLIEDDIKLKKYISEYLECYDYKVNVIEDFDNLMETIEKKEYKLM